MNCYYIEREFLNQYTAINLVQHIIQQHLDENSAVIYNSYEDDG